MPETRDWQEDWKMCEQASQGPWKWENGDIKCRDNGKITDADGFGVCWFGNYTTYYPIAGEEPEEKDIQFMTVSREALPYWLEQYKKKSELYDELKEQLARINCDYHSLKDKFLNMREECGAEKKRASAAEERELTIKNVLEEIINASTYSTYETFEEIGKAKEIYKNIYGETL